jgi:hypothetical protein
MTSCIKGKYLRDIFEGILVENNLNITVNGSVEVTLWEFKLW